MEQGMIACPSCGHVFELSNALTGHIREHLRDELLQELKQREAELNQKRAAIKAGVRTVQHIVRDGSGQRIARGVAVKLIGAVDLVAILA